MPYLFTSESVSEGHPDKLCDRVSDTVLDLFLVQEPEARVACETFATTNRVIIGGEVRVSEDKMSGIMDSIERAIRGAIADIGYEQDEFHHAHLEFQNYLHKQSTDIAMGVDSGDNKDEGAGDQGLMFGYACRDLLFASDPEASCRSQKGGCRHNSGTGFQKPDHTCLWR